MPKFGIITTVSGIESIIIQSINKKTSAEIAEARNEEGKVIALQAYSQGKSVDIRALLNADEIQTEAGQSLSIDGANYIIESTDQAENNTGWIEVSLSARTADEAKINTYTASGK